MYILCQITPNLQSSLFLNVMVTMDVSNHEQIVLCVRWVSADLDVHEDFIYIYGSAKLIRSILAL